MRLVCPEPVLAKWSLVIRNMAEEKDVSRTLVLSEVREEAPQPLLLLLVLRLCDRRERTCTHVRPSKKTTCSYHIAIAINR